MTETDCGRVIGRARRERTREDAGMPKSVCSRKALRVMFTAGHLLGDLGRRRRQCRHALLVGGSNVPPPPCKQQSIFWVFPESFRAASATASGGPSGRVGGDDLEHRVAVLVELGGAD